MKNLTIILSIFIALTLKTNAQTNVSGIISSNTDWTLANSPYIVTGNVLVNNGVTLTIEPGVIVKFNSTMSLHIEGTLIARGTASDNITFTSNTVDTTGAWGYIYFSDESTDAVFQNDINGIYLGGSILEYCIIQYAGGSSVADNGALRFDRATPFVNYCTITNNSASGIRAYGIFGNLKISNSVITNNVSLAGGGGIYIFYDLWDNNDATSLITSNIISYNSTIYSTSTSGGGPFSGGGIYIFASTDKKTIIISNNIISNNTAHNGGGIYNEDFGTTYIYNNAIINNTAFENPGGFGSGGGGIYSIMTRFNNVRGSIHENILSNNTSLANGGGILLFPHVSWVSAPVISKNVIADNVASGNAGGIYSWAITATTFFDNNHIVRNTAHNNAGIFYYHGFDGSIKYNTIAYNKNTDYNNPLNRTLFLSNGSHPEIKNNNIFNNSTFYELYNDNAQGTANVAATSNWWGTAINTEIQAKIYDWLDNSALGVVNYSPYLSVADTIAPVSPPANVTKTNLGGGQVQLTWQPNPETDIAGYIVYFGNFNGFAFANSVNVGKDTTYVLTGVSVLDTIAVTAYDSAYNIANENVFTITNDNMTNGNESWFTFAETECNTITLTMSAVDASCSTCSDGTATANISFGSAPFTYLWSTVPPQNSSTAIGLMPDTYTVSITDNNGCVLTGSVGVSFSTSVDEKTNSSLISVYPNPANDIVYLNIDYANIVDVTLNIYDVIGNLVKSEILNQNQRQINVENLSNGTYIVEINSKEQSWKQKLIIQR